MTLSDYLMIGAVILAPLIAVQVSQYLQHRQSIRNERLKIFKTLMSTRATNLESSHVEALNMIDVAFYSKKSKDRNVVSSWRIYLDHLNDLNYPKENWEPRRKELFVDLMHDMASSLGYDFDKSQIKNTSYYPGGHGELAGDQFLLRKGVLALLEGKISLPVKISDTGASEASASHVSNQSQESVLDQESVASNA
ncbi:DUF6680 family protein [Microbulbifer sp. Q7]|uniref:DUF6680 family protein n=1 Tax=Microbulbifer sp. Q7 TaxID=1785091 RepID=UPI00082D9251|nr:DUF6680 family protein [Microbulbifer sp. Q7]